MSLQWVEGFEVRRQADFYADLYDEAPTGLISSSFQAGRLHGYAFDGSSNLHTWLTRSLEAHATWIIGIAAQINSPNDALDAVFIGVQDDSTPQLSLYIKEDGSSDDYYFELWRGDNSTGTLLDTSAVQDGADGYNYWELKVTIANTGGTWELRRNGVVVMSGIGDTQNTGNATGNKIRFSSQRETSAVIGTPRFDLDDIYINNGSGTFNNDFLGDQVVEGILPNAAGDSTDFVAEDLGSPSGNPNWQEVDDDPESAGGPDDDDGYVTADVAGDKDLYNFQNLSFVTGDINGVMIVNRVRLEASGLRVLKNVFKDPVSGEADAGSPFNVNKATWDDYPVIVERNPATSGLFSVSQIDGGQWGFEIVS